MKKFFSMMLTAILVLSMSTVAFAAGTDRDDYADKLNVPANFNKVYDIVNEATKSPAETFTFEFEAVSVKEQEAGITLEDAPQIADVTTSFVALTEDTTNEVEVALDAADFPGIGIYTYKVTEKVGNTAGVTYQENPIYLVVTILRDTDDNIKYVAAVHYSSALTGDKTGEVTNKYEASSLSITKEVTGNMGDKTREFKVTVTFTAPENKIVNEAITYLVGTEEKEIVVDKWENGKAEAEISLKHGDTITFNNIPYGVTYVVEENDYTSEANGGYDPAVYTYDDDNKKIDTATADTVKITNNKGTTVDTGITLDSAPYMMMLIIAAAGIAFFLAKKRRYTED